MDRARADELAELIRKHQRLYYDGEAEISDEAFDELWDELKAIDPDNPVLRVVGSDSSEAFPKTEHLMPMGSQEKASDPESFLAWAEKVAHQAFIVQFKMDGASLELQYSGGRFMKAVTRGDGRVGDDITPNALRMSGFPLSVEGGFTGAVRGEVLLPRAVFKAKHPEKANCRNAANGIMKRKDGKGCEDLVVLCYDAVDLGPTPAFSRERDKVPWLARMGFSVVHQEVFSRPQEVIDYRGRIMDERPRLEYDIDGLVVKGDDIDPEDMARARPEGQIAFKFSLEEAVTTLREVEWSESGASFVPVGIVDPVQLNGTTVQRASLNNPDMIRSLGLMIGSRVVVTKRGEIIPKIECLVENPPGARSIEQPKACSCGSALVDGGSRLYCPNPECPKKAYHRLRKWLDVLGVLEFGDVLLKKLFDSGRVRKIADLYGLREEELASLDRMGEKSATTILRNLASKNSMSLSVFLAGFDIEGIGELIADRFVQAGWDSLDKLLSAKVEDLEGIFGIGRLTAEAFIKGLEELGPQMRELVGSGAVRIISQGGEGSLSGLSFCFTGELSMKRSEAEAMVKARGGSVKSSVTKGLSYLVTNDPLSGSAKNKKAADLGVRIIDEDGFLAVVEGKP